MEKKTFRDWIIDLEEEGYFDSPEFESREPDFEEEAK